VQSVLQQRCDQGIGKRSIDSHDMLTTLTLYKPARPLSGRNSVRVIEFAFRCNQGTWFVKPHFSCVPSRSGTENAPETMFQAPKPSDLD